MSLEAMNWLQTWCTPNAISLVVALGKRYLMHVLKQSISLSYNNCQDTTSSERTSYTARQEVRKQEYQWTKEVTTSLTPRNNDMLLLRYQVVLITWKAACDSDILLVHLLAYLGVLLLCFFVLMITTHQQNEQETGDFVITIRSWQDQPTWADHDRITAQLGSPSAKRNLETILMNNEHTLFMCLCSCLSCSNQSNPLSSFGTVVTVYSWSYFTFLVQQAMTEFQSILLFHTVSLSVKSKTCFNAQDKDNE